MPALLLLAAFVAGGLVVPAVHQAEHALHFQQDLAEIRHAHAGHAHDGRPALENGLGHTSAHAPCLLCLVRWDPATNGLATSAPAWAAVPHTVAAPAAPPSAPLLLLPIRGPPAVA